MNPAPPRLLSLPSRLFEADPLPTLLEQPLPRGEPWGWLLSRNLLQSEPVARRLLAGTPKGLVQIIDEDLKRLRDLRGWLRQRHPVADFGDRPAAEAERAALEVLEQGDAAKLIALYRSHGFAPFSCNSAFVWDGELTAVERPDEVDFSELVGYEEQLATLQNNVLRFLNGKPALSTLLYGARGTGKSTAVKALRAIYAERGLRLIEVLPEGLAPLPLLLERLGGLPQRFLLYIDDLSYEANDPGWRKLKAMLDGSVWTTPPNTLFIATSNRKNLIREGWGDRPDPNSEPGAWDGLQEKLALADRFGLHVTFPPFDQKLYLLAVAHHLGKKELDDATRAAALRFALEGRGFSGRTAKQFAIVHS